MRNVFGELQYEKGCFFVLNRVGGTGKYAVLKREPWYVTDAVFSENPWERAPLFDSFISACVWLSRHYKELL